MAANTTSQNAIFFSSEVVPEVSRASVICAILGFSIFLRLVAVSFGNAKPPFAGFRSWIEPDLLVRLRFSWGAMPMIAEGYQKFEKGYYRLARNDRDILVIPNDFVDELRSLPQESLSSIKALLANLVSKYSASDLLLESDLHTRVLQTKITPNLPKFVPNMKDELDYAASKALPTDCDQWKEVEIYEILLQFVARISARIFVGHPLCRNEEWIETSIKYAEQATITVMTLRAFPKALHPIICNFVPAYWNTMKWVRRGKELLVPVILARREQQKKKPDSEKPMDFLQWMMDGADARDGVPEKLAHRELIMGLASVHTTTMAAAHFLYDLYAHPESDYVVPLREEIVTTLREDGGWKGMTANKLRKMDSFLKESQRLNPASLLGFHRIVQDRPIELSDGKVLRPGDHICLASYEISKDPSVIPNPEFDGFRYYHLRKDPEEDKKLQYAMTDKNHLHFGHGRFACPGRFFAANELKMILGELLLDFDFKYPDGRARPRNVNADEFLYPDQSARLLMRKRAREDLV